MHLIITSFNIFLFFKRMFDARKECEIFRISEQLQKIFAVEVNNSTTPYANYSIGLSVVQDVRSVLFSYFKVISSLILLELFLKLFTKQFVWSVLLLLI